MKCKEFCTYSKLKLSFVELPLHKYHLFTSDFSENPIKSVIEISKFLFDISPSHQVTISLKGYTYPKTVYNFCGNPPFLHTSTFQLDFVK